jgi:hypothetical protein
MFGATADLSQRRDQMANPLHQLAIYCNREETTGFIASHKLDLADFRENTQ